MTVALPMSTEKPKGPDDSADLTEIGEAFSSKVWSRALDSRVRKHPKFFEFLWQGRFWWIVAAAVTFVLPVLHNNNTAALSYSRSDILYGFDLLVPMLSTESDDGSYVYVSSFTINPLALAIYGLAALHLYLLFVKTRVSWRLTLWHGLIQTVGIALFPFIDIPVMTYILRGFGSHWHVQPPMVGFWILLLSGLALWGGAYGQIVRGSPIPEEPPPLK
jgi:hypothetical protein